MQTQPTAATWCTPASDPADDERMARGAIAGFRWFESASLEAHYPLTTDEVVTLLRDGGQYAIDAGDLADLLVRRIVPKPSLSDDGTELEFNATDIMLVAGALESRRQWQHPSHHDSKRHPADIEVQRARLAGTLEGIVDAAAPVPRWDVQGLYALLLACDNREGREKVGALLKAVLEVDHGVFVL